jgi:hypothetical protein
MTLSHDERLVLVIVIVLFAGMLVGFFWGRIYEEYASFKKAKKVPSVYDQMNETQLQVELKNAEDEDRFEDAAKIRDILNTKFR